MKGIPIIDAGIIGVARWWFKHYPSDIFITGEIAEIRKQFACLMIRRHKNRMHNLSQNTKKEFSDKSEEFAIIE